MMFSTFAEQRYFIYPAKTTYRGAIINANMAVHAPDGLAAFLLERTAAFSYIIDPLTHAFQHDPRYVMNSEGEAKPSISALAKAYGTPFEDLVAEKALAPDDVTDETVQSLVERCLGFQENILAKAMEDSDANKYLEKTATELRPQALVAPYFYMTDAMADEWLEINVKLAKCAVAAGRDLPVYAGVVIHPGILQEEQLTRRVSDALAGTGVKGFLLWVDDFDEHTAASAELRGFLRLVRGLSAGGLPVINLHGGYFSILAAGEFGGRALTGVTHAPEFGEYRSVVPVGGGIPIARYYVPLLHRRVRYRDAVRYFHLNGWLESSTAFHHHVCSCDECTETLSGDVDRFVLFGVSETKSVRRGSRVARIDYPLPDTREHCLRHYLQRKQIEYGFADSASAEQILHDLRRGQKEMKAGAGQEGIAHLVRWEQVLARAS
jgi:hypothetical protein